MSEAIITIEARELLKLGDILIRAAKKLTRDELSASIAAAGESVTQERIVSAGSGSSDLTGHEPHGETWSDSGEAYAAWASARPFVGSGPKEKQVITEELTRALEEIVSVY
ncbi:hypothetical protein NQX30_04815 [Candidatus Persebacteraceae bacterium Df01]|jgi:hypothetical protein|uniref:HK97 gp10 family phage protein n=1 Tax=Candidatus Doriopsillibacter californiensis TaxID=2970740 RepID=A0ABT7QLX6_9GAMM|nr:hypothetical protein [Candidatus Persebacteraceae bacterium Df01]